MIYKIISLKNNDSFTKNTINDFNNKHFLNEDKQKASQEAFDKYIIGHYKENRKYCKFVILSK